MRRTAIPAAISRRCATSLQTNGDLFALNLDYFTHDKEGVDMTWDEGSPRIGRIYSDKLVETFGPARKRVARSPRTTRRRGRAADDASRRSTSISLERLQERTGMTNLCLAGGVALNAVANGRIRPETPFEELYVQPAAGDSGTAIGAAYFVWNQTLGSPAASSCVMRSPAPSTRRTSIRGGLAAAGLSAERLDDDALFRSVAEHIAAGDVVGWFQGRMEFGPRALGHRSIVADPRSATMKDVLNARIKHREPFRPFAPRSSPKRPATGSTRTIRRRSWCSSTRRAPASAPIPAVNHVDDTGRVQSVEREVAPRYYRLIERIRAADRRADPPEHVVQRERADRHDARGRARHVPQDEDGHPRARELRASPQRRLVARLVSASFLGRLPGQEEWVDRMAAADNYNKWLVERAKPFVGSRVLDFGAQTGTFMRRSPHARTLWRLSRIRRSHRGFACGSLTTLA